MGLDVMGARRRLAVAVHYRDGDLSRLTNATGDWQGDLAIVLEALERLTEVTQRAHLDAMNVLNGQPTSMDLIDDRISGLEEQLKNADY